MKKTIVLISLMLLNLTSCKKEQYDPNVHGKKDIVEVISKISVFGLSCDQYYEKLSTELDELTELTNKKKIKKIRELIKQNDSKSQIEKNQKHEKFEKKIFNVSYLDDDTWELSYPALENAILSTLEKANRSEVEIQTEDSKIKLNFSENKDSVIIDDHSEIKDVLYNTLAPECESKSKTQVIETKED